MMSAFAGRLLLSTFRVPFLALIAVGATFVWAGSCVDDALQMCGVRDVRFTPNEHVFAAAVAALFR
jgi:hypothetical protein